MKKLAMPKLNLGEEASPRPDPATAVAPMPVPMAPPPTARREPRATPPLTSRLPVEKAAAAGVAAPAPDGAAVTARWDAFAELYSRNFRLWSSVSSQALVAALELDRGMGILEVGCGAGHQLKNIRTESAFGAGFRAVDASEEMVKRAGDISAQAGCIVSVGDAQDLGGRWEERFDRVIANLVVHIVPDPDKALGEFYRVCAPGGCVGFSVWGRREHSPLFTLLDDVLASLRADGAIPPSAASSKATRSQFHLGADDAALRARAAAAGFLDVVSWHVPCAWPRSVGQMRPAGETFAESWLQSQLSTVELKRTLDAAQWAAVVSGLAAAAQTIYDAGSPIACDVVVVVGRKPPPPDHPARAKIVEVKDIHAEDRAAMNESPEAVLKRIIRDADLEAWKEEERRDAQNAVDAAVAVAEGRPPPAPKPVENMHPAEERYRAIRDQQDKLSKQGPSG